MRISDWSSDVCSSDLIGEGAAQSWQMDNRGATMCQGKFDFGFAVDWMRKDLGICLAEAKTNGARLPVTALVDQFYGQVQARGGNRWATSSLMQLLAKDCGRRGARPPHHCRPRACPRAPLPSPLRPT